MKIFKYLAVLIVLIPAFLVIKKNSDNPLSGSVMAGPYPGGGLRDHGHTAPGDGGVLNTYLRTIGTQQINSTITVTSNITFDNEKLKIGAAGISDNATIQFFNGSITSYWGINGSGGYSGVQVGNNYLKVFPNDSGGLDGIVLTNAAGAQSLKVNSLGITASAASNAGYNYYSTAGSSPKYGKVGYEASTYTFYSSPDESVYTGNAAIIAGTFIGKIQATNMPSVYSVRTDNSRCTTSDPGIVIATITVTPQSVNSKFLLQFTGTSNNSSGNTVVRLKRGNTTLNSGNAVWSQSVLFTSSQTAFGSLVDSPSLASGTTSYYLQMGSVSGIGRACFAPFASEFGYFSAVESLQ